MRVDKIGTLRILVVGLLAHSLPHTLKASSALDPVPLGEAVCLVDKTAVLYPRAVAPHQDGFLIAYRGFTSDRILATVSDQVGEPVGPVLEVDEPFVGEQSRVDDVHRTSDGGWIVVWSGQGSPGGDVSFSVKARVYDSAGAPKADSFQVNSSEAGTQSDGRATSLDSGTIVVVFQSNQPGGGTDVRARLFSVEGMPLGADFVVTTSTDEGRSPDVVPAPGGGFLVVYTDSFGERTLGVRQFDAGGVLVDSNRFRLSSASGALNELHIEADSLGPVYVAAILADDNNLGIELVALEWSGSRYLKGPTHRVSPVEISHLRPSVLVSASGDVSLVWEENPTNTVGEGNAVVQRFSTALEPISNRIKVDQAGALNGVTAALLQDGRALVAWNEFNQGCDGQGRFVYMPELLFGDGFESGSTEAWSHTVP